MSLDELLHATNQLSETDLETLVNGILLLHARCKAPILLSQEATLLLQINQGISAELHQHYHGLVLEKC